LCVRALGAIGHPGALKPLIDLAESPVAELRPEAREALRLFPQAELSLKERALLHDVLSRSQAGTPVAGVSLLRPADSPVPAGRTPLPAAPRAQSFGSPGFDTASPGARPVNFTELPPDHVLLHRYRVIRKIGRGGFGTVYLVEDSAIQEEIILKILNPQLSLDETAARRFVQELRLTRKISHRNVIRIHDFLDLGGVHAVSMEYFPGTDLGHLMDREAPLTVTRGLGIAAQVCAGLAAAHAEGVIHRDIKPPNILVGAGDEVRLVDFGLASAQQNAGSRLTKSGLLIGTPEYMAPEQISGAAADHRADLYAVGIVMYEMFSGERPYTAETPVKVLFQHLEGGAVPLEERVPGLPHEVAQLVSRAMARDAGDRPASAAELRDLIERTAEALGASR
jgi:serine/threonine-protein kinase